MVIAGTLLWGIDVSPSWARVLCWILWSIAVFIYLIPGHALIYGPHLFILKALELLTKPFRNTKI